LFPNPYSSFPRKREPSAFLSEAERKALDPRFRGDDDQYATPHKTTGPDNRPDP